MTHTSDVSYMHRATAGNWVFLFLIVHIFRNDRFAALHYERLLRFEVRSVVTVLLLVGIPLQMIYDYGLVEIKYQVGFFAVPNTGVVVGVPNSGMIVGTPFQVWTPDQKERALVLNYVLAMALASHSSMLFMLQAFWSYITKSIARHNFMTSIEYKLTLTWSAMVIGLFPLMQWLYRDNMLARELAPQLGFAVNHFILGCMGIRSHFRFNAVIESTRDAGSDSARTVIGKLEYYQFMNKLLGVGLFGTSFSLAIPCIDGLVAHPYIQTHKVMSDFFITQLNLAEPILFLSVIMILYPRKTSNHANFGDTSKGSKGSAVLAKANKKGYDKNEGDHKYQQDDNYHQVHRPSNSNGNENGAIPLESFNKNGSNNRSYHGGPPSQDQYQENNQRRPSNGYTARSVADSSTTANSQALRSKEIKMPSSYENYDRAHDPYIQTFKDTDQLTDIKHSTLSIGAMQGVHHHQQLAHQLSQDCLNSTLAKYHNANNPQQHQQPQQPPRQSDDYYQGLQNIEPVNGYQNGRPSLTMPRAQSPTSLSLSPRQQFSNNIMAPSSPPPISNPSHQYMLDDALLAHTGTLSLSPSQTNRPPASSQHQQQQHHQTPILTAKNGQRNQNGGNNNNNNNVQYLSQPTR